MACEKEIVGIVETKLKTTNNKQKKQLKTKTKNQKPKQTTGNKEQGAKDKKHKQ